MSAPDFPELPAVPWIGARRSQELRAAYEAARRRWRAEHKDGPVEVTEKPVE